MATAFNVSQEFNAKEKTSSYLINSGTSSYTYTLSTPAPQFFEKPQELRSHLENKGL